MTFAEKWRAMFWYLQQTEAAHAQRSKRLAQWIAAPAGVLGRCSHTRTVERARESFRHSPLSWFAVITFVWTWSIWLSLALTGLHYELRIWKYLYVAGLSGPLVGAGAIALMTGGWRGGWRLVKQVFIWKVSPAWYALGLFLAPALMLGTVFITRAVLHEKVEIPTPPLTWMLLAFGWMVVRGGPANEEVGWRGFLLPHLLKRHNPFWATLILIPIWAAWHWPLWVLPGVPHKYWPFSYFFMLIAPISFLFTWLHVRARGSVLIAILFHSAINTTIHFVPLVPPRYPSLAPFAFWIGLTWAVTMLVIWTDRRIWFAEPKKELACARRLSGGSMQMAPLMLSQPPARNWVSGCPADRWKWRR